MGYFSWLDCKTGKPIKIGQKAYVLIPKVEYGGGYYEEESYDGYGHFDGMDIFEVVASWNRHFLNESMLMPKPELSKFGGLWSYEENELKCMGYTTDEIKAVNKYKQLQHYKAAVKRRNDTLLMMQDYMAGDSDYVMKQRWGNDYLREIGIAIAIYDEQNKKLPYPIKITHDKNAVYEDCSYSKGDPNQGC